MSFNCPPREPTGTNSLDQFLAGLVRFCRGSRVVSSADIAVSYTSDGTLLSYKRNPQSGGQGATVSKFRITAVGISSLTCQLFNSSGLSGSYSVARPPLLRAFAARQTRDDFYLDYVDANTRTKTTVDISSGYSAGQPVDGTYSFTQKLEPSYAVGDDIYAVQDYEGNWIDLNVDGRQWQTVAIQTGICVNGEAYSVMIERSGRIQPSA